MDAGSITLGIIGILIFRKESGAARNNFVEALRQAMVLGHGAGGTARASTEAGSSAARRPQRKALRLKSTATPFNSIARSIAAAETGTKPF